MDWKYKHFEQEAVFSAPINDVLTAARAAVGDSFGQIENTADGFVASRHSAWHLASATFRAASVPSGTRLGVELLVERASGRGYMLFDVGGYYSAEIDKWFGAVAERLGRSGGETLVSKTTSSLRWQRGCLVGCVVWVMAAICLGVAGIALDAALFSQPSNSTGGPFSIAGSSVALLAGITAFLYVTFPESSVARSVRGWLGSRRKS